MKTTIVDVVYYMLSKQKMSPKKIQKMCYYIQGWYVATYGKFLFEEDFEAWVHGPVCPELYFQLKEYGSSDLYVSESSAEDVELTRKQKKFIDGILETYGHFTANELENYTHQESPWKDARKGLSRWDYSQNEISKKAIKKYFSRRMEE